MKNDLPNLLKNIIQNVENKLPPENIRDARQLLDYNEWGESLSLIYTQLYEYDVPVSRLTYDLIESAGTLMKMDKSGWKILTILK